MAKEITRFAYGELGQVYYRRFDEINPEFKPRRGGGWQSPFKLDLSDPHERREDKCVVTPNYMFSVYEQGGEPVSIYDYYMQKRGITDFVVAVKEIAGKLGVPVPDSWNAANEGEWMKRQNALDAVSRKMQEALHSEAGAGTLRYLSETRGYSEDFIKFAEFGFCDSKTAEAVARALGKKGINRDIGKTHTLSIPYRSGGRIYGFVFRTITEGVKSGEKYRDAFISESDTKKYHLFGLTGLTLRGGEEERREITIVEGELDALRASYAGALNVCAASGGNIYTEAVEEAKRRGVERITILFDIGETLTEAKIRRGIEIISGAGLSSFVCSLPSEGGKQDPDSFLKDHSGAELQDLLNGAVPGYVYLFRRLLADSIERQGGEGELSTFKDISIFRSETFKIYESKGITPEEKGFIGREFEDATGQIITANLLAEEAERRKKEEDAKRQRSETDAALKRARELWDSGKTAEAIEEMGRASELRGISRDAEYERADYIETREERKRRRAETPTGVETQYFFKTKHGEKRLVIPRGALTFISGATSHGKSRMLQNLALQIATDGTAGDVLYFTFEESKTDTELELLNIFVNMHLSNGNLTSLRSYYNRGEDFFSRDTDRKAFREKEEEFDTLLDSGRLRVYYEDWDCEALVGYIRYAYAKRRIKAVFIDYVQEVQTSGKNTKKEAMAEICAEFKKLSVETQLPIILAAQVNREVLSPIEMDVQNIADASDIEHSANVVMLLWNSVVKPRPKSTYKSGDKLSSEAQELEDRGFHIGEDGKIYALLAKNRGGERNADAVLDFNGNTGRISQPEEDLPETPAETPKRKNPLKLDFSEEIPFGQS